MQFLSWFLFDHLLGDGPDPVGAPSRRVAADLKFWQRVWESPHVNDEMSWQTLPQLAETTRPSGFRSR